MPPKTNTKKRSDYLNIPVKKDVYTSVKLIAEANGYGERGMGAQVAHWVGRELHRAECAHEKVPVEIQYFPGATSPLAFDLKRTAWYCNTCKRVYARITETELAVEDGKKLLARVRVTK